MTQLLELRERLIKFYQEYTRVVNAVFLFAVALITFTSLSRVIGFDPFLKSWYMILAVSLICSVLPRPVFLIMAAIYTVWHIHYVSSVLAVVTFMIFLFFYLVYIRFLQEHGFVIVAVPILFVLKLPYLAPIFLGMTGSVAAVIPMSFGVVCYYMLQGMTTVIGTATEDNLLLYNQALQLIFSDQEMYLTITGFAIVAVIISIIRNHEFDYAFETAIAVGAVINVLYFLGVSFAFDIHINVIYLLLQTVVSVLAAWIMWFFRLILNYTASEYLQFEDDEYYYYVKAIPKVSITAGEKRVKRFNAHLLGGNGYRHDAAEDKEEK